MKGNDSMAKASTVLKTTETVKAEIKSVGILRVDESGKLFVETDDFGLLDILSFIDELHLRDVEVELKITAKQETEDEVDPLSV